MMKQQQLLVEDKEGNNIKGSQSLASKKPLHFRLLILVWVSLLSVCLLYIDYRSLFPTTITKQVTKWETNMRTDQDADNGNRIRQDSEDDEEEDEGEGEGEGEEEVDRDEEEEEDNEEDWIQQRDWQARLKRQGRMASFYFPQPSDLPVTTPVLVVGMMKSGTSTIGDFFRCNNHTVSHNRCRGGRFCGQMIHDNIQNDMPPLADKWEYQVYAQMDYAVNCHFPQITDLEKFHQHYPDATMILNTRPVEHWIRSVENWGNLLTQLQRCDIPGMPGGIGGIEATKELYLNQTKRVLDFVKKYPSHTLVEVDIESDTAGNIMVNAFGGSPDCWNSINKSKKLHSKEQAQQQLRAKRMHTKKTKGGRKYRTSRTTNQNPERDTDITGLLSSIRNRNVTSSLFLPWLIEARGKRCRVTRQFEPNDVSYLGVARSGSTTLHSQLESHHDHDCTLRDLEELGARRVIVSLRHPLARISSGFSRRIEGKQNQKPANKLLHNNFQGGGIELLISSLRDVSHPLHDVAVESTFGPHRQSYFLPVTEFYLRHSYNQSEVYFLCMESFQDDLEAARAHWKYQTNKRGPTSRDAEAHWSAGSNWTVETRNPSVLSSGNWTFVLSRFSQDTIRWVENTYSNDIALYQQHCPKGYQAYLESLSLKLQTSVG